MEVSGARRDACWTWGQGDWARQAAGLGGGRAVGRAAGLKGVGASRAATPIVLWLRG